MKNYKTKTLEVGNVENKKMFLELGESRKCDKCKHLMKGGEKHQCMKE